MKSSEISEMRRHHLVMEEVETKRQKSEGEVTKWKSKREELIYMSSLEEKFEELKRKRWSDKRILRVYPDLAPFVMVDDESTNDDSP